MQYTCSAVRSSLKTRTIERFLQWDVYQINAAAGKTLQRDPTPTFLNVYKRWVVMRHKDKHCRMWTEQNANLVDTMKPNQHGYRRGKLWSFFNKDGGRRQSNN